LEASAAPGYRVLAKCDPRADLVESVWLDDIVKTPHGFTGVVREPSQLLRQIRVGQTIAFGQANVLDWTLSSASDGACDATPPENLACISALEPEPVIESYERRY
jgi:uncharacterized protein YegJ (DUF2314 family)